MKLQYLGDSRDSFKWDYHDYLTALLDYPLLNVAFMMTPDDNNNHGNTNPKRFPARQEIINFCNNLRTERDERKLSERFNQGYIEEVSSELFELIGRLPTTTGSRYSVDLHKGAKRFTNINRMEYFSDIHGECRQVLFLDPDNGFEPTGISDKHISYSDIESMLQQISEKAVISVFQYFRFKSFLDDYNHIKQRLMSGYSTAIYTHSVSVMFVAISKSEKTIDKVRYVNIQYKQNRPVEIIQ
ncbi:MAG: hypothetical protein ABSE95_04040 [Thermodesulfobacteriota bacterium]